MQRQYNQEAGMKTRQEYLDNFEAVKGEGARRFIEETAFTLSAGDGLNAGLRGLLPLDAGQNVLVDLLNAHISLLADKYGITQEQGEELLKDTRTMMKAIDEAAQSNVITLRP